MCSIGFRFSCASLVGATARHSSTNWDIETLQMMIEPEALQAFGKVW